MWKEIDDDVLRTRKKKSQVVEIDPEMYDIISRISNLNSSSQSTTKTTKIRLSPKKRKKPSVVPVPDLMTKISVTEPLRPPVVYSGAMRDS